MKVTGSGPMASSCKRGRGSSGPAAAAAAEEEEEEVEEEVK
jgi:hypothetical protein